MLTIKHPLPPGIPGQIERLRDWLPLPPSLRGDGAGANAVLGEVAASHARLVATVEDLIALSSDLIAESLPGPMPNALARIGRAREALLRTKGG